MGVMSAMSREGDEWDGWDGRDGRGGRMATLCYERTLFWSPCCRLGASSELLSCWRSYTLKSCYFWGNDRQ